MANWQAAFNIQAAQLAQLQAEMTVRREQGMDSMQYEQLMLIQQEAVKALREQKDKTLLDKMKNKTNRRLLEYLLNGQHLVEDVNLLWKGVFDEETSRENPITIANLAKVNKAFIKQSELLSGFNAWLKEERTVVEVANISKEGWSAAEIFKEGLGKFSADDKANTKRIRIR